MKFIVMAAAVAVATVASPAWAQHPHHARHSRHYVRVAPDSNQSFIYLNGRRCIVTDGSHYVCDGASRKAVGASFRVGGRQGTSRGRTRTARASYGGYEGVRYIPHPSGCPYRLFCACGLAHYWHLGKGLNAVVTWTRRFPHVSGPGIGVAAVRRDRHHIMGIVGRTSQGWEVVDFNSGGHRSRRYVRSDFSGYFFVDPSAARYASN